jgi:hypothetical protein
MRRSERDARRPRAASPGHRAAVRIIALAGLVHMLRNRAFRVRLIIVAIGVVAAGRMGRENAAGAFARLVAWDKRQVKRLERKVKAQGRVITGSRR